MSARLKALVGQRVRVVVPWPNACGAGIEGTLTHFPASAHWPERWQVHVKEGTWMSFEPSAIASFGVFPEGLFAYAAEIRLRGQHNPE